MKADTIFTCAIIGYIAVALITLGFFLKAVGPFAVFIASIWPASFLIILGAYIGKCLGV